MAYVLYNSGTPGFVTVLCLSNTAVICRLCPGEVGL